MSLNLNNLSIFLHGLESLRLKEPKAFTFIVWSLYLLEEKSIDKAINLKNGCFQAYLSFSLEMTKRVVALLVGVLRKNVGLLEGRKRGYPFF